MKKEIIICGTGGFAAELTEYIEHNNLNSKVHIKIIGYLDVDKQNYLRYGYKAPFLGSEQEYTFKQRTIVFVAIGDSKIRQKIINILTEKNVLFDNFIHHSCIVSSSSIVGKGNIICPNVIIGPNTKIGNFNILNYSCAIPHDCEMGNMNILSPNVYITGYCKIGDNNFFGVSSGCTPSLKIGSNNKIQAGIILNINVEDNNIVFSMNKIKKMKLYK